MSLSSIGRTEDSDLEERMKRLEADNKTEEECNAEFKKAIEEIDIKMYKALEIWESKRFEKLDKRSKKLEESNMELREASAEQKKVRKP